MAENRRIPVEDLEDPVFQRIRQRLQNTVEGGNGSIKPDELASYFYDLNGPQRAALFREFQPKLGTDFFNTALRIQGNYDKTWLGKGLGLWNDANAALSDFASLDRDDENFVADTVRGLSNIPLAVSEGFKTGGQGLAENVLNVDEEDRFNDGSLGDQLLETTGVLGALGKPLQLLRPAAQQTKNIATKIYNNPKALLNPKKLYRGVKENKLPLIAGGAIAGAKSLDRPDGSQDVIVDSEGNETASINAPLDIQTRLGVPEETGTSASSPASATATATPYGGTAQAGAQPDLSNPAGLVAMANNLGKSSNSLLGRRMQGDLTAQASRQIQQDVANQRGENKINDLINSRERDLRMAWLKSPSNKAGIPFEQLSPAEQMKMRENYFASRRAGSYNSRDERKKELAAKFKATGSYGVGELDDMTEEEFMKKSGMQNPGTILVSNPDGTFTTNESKQAFDRAGGRDSALNVFDDLGDNGAMGANLDHQLNGDRTVIGKDGQRLEDLTPGSVRMSSNDSDYDDARFNSREDALAYLNRKPESQPDTPQTPEEEDEMNPLLKYGLPIAGTAALLHPSTRKKGTEMIKRGLNAFKKAPPPAAKNLWTSTVGGYTGKTPEQLGRAAANAPKSMSNPWTSSVGGYTGGTPEQVGRAAQAAQAATKSNPWTSNVGGYTGRTPQDFGRAANIPPKVTPETPWVSSSNMRPPARTPQDVGVANRPAPQSPWSSTSNMQTPKPPAITPQDIGRASAPALQTPWSSARNIRPASPPAVTPQDIGMGNRAAPMSPWASSRNVRPQTPQVPAATPQSIGAANRQAAQMKQVNDYVDNLADADYAGALKRFGLGKNVSRQQLKDILGKTSFGRLSLDNL